eukprot:superscaffoldBa00001864_g12305
MTQVGDAPGCSSWAMVVKGKRKLSLSLYDPHGIDNSLQLFNHLISLAKVTDNPVSPSSHALKAKYVATSSKRRYILNMSNSQDSSPIGKHPRLSASTSVGSISPRGNSMHALQVQPMPPSSHKAIYSSNVNEAKLDSAVISNHQLPPKLSVCSATGNYDNPEVLVLGDSIIRSLDLLGATTYCLSGGQVADFIELTPTLIDLHPLVHTVIVHAEICQLYPWHQIALPQN